MTTVRQHERSKPRKPSEYIDTHLALFSRRADAAASLNRHNVPIVTVDDPRLSVPVADPVPGPGRVSIESIKRQAAALAKMVRWPS